MSARTDMAMSEARLLKLVGASQHCVRLLDCYFENGLSYVVLDLCDATLFATFERVKVLTEHSVVPFAVGMLKGISHVHQLGIVHRDVKPDNFLCSGPQCTVKLCDFGVASLLSCPTDETAIGVSGTTAFLSPEMILGKRYGTKTDIWSLGVLMYSLFFGCLPYDSKDCTSSGLKQSIKSGSIPPSYALPASLRQTGSLPVSMRAQDFVRAMLVREPSRRMTAVEAMSSPYLTEACGLHVAGAPSIRPMLHSAQRLLTHSEVDFEDHFDAVNRRLRRLQETFQGQSEYDFTKSGSAGMPLSSSVPTRRRSSASAGSKGNDALSSECSTNAGSIGLTAETSSSSLQSARMSTSRHS